MSKVYALAKAYDYEGESFRGVFSSLEKAEAAIVEIEEGCDDWVIYEVRVDAVSQPVEVRTTPAK
jgi:hypothetical protein